MTSDSREAVLRQLTTVLDPCSLAMGSAVDVVAMGLVERVDIVASRVHIDLVLTDVSCVFYNDIRRHIADAVGALEWVNDVEVTLDASVMWTPDRMRPKDVVAR